MAADGRQELWTQGGTACGYREGDALWTYDGRHLGRFSADEVYAASGWYLGELRRGRLASADMKRLQRREAFAPAPARVAIAPPGRRMPLAAEPGYEDFLGPV